MIRFFVLNILVMTANLALAGSGVGNTAFVVRCSSPSSAGQPAAGIYLDDYLMTMGADFKDHKDYSDETMYFSDISKVLDAVSLKVGADFRLFKRLFLNKDETQRYVWEKAGYRLAQAKKEYDLNGDSGLTTEEKYAYESLPLNCHKDGVADRKIVIIKESSKISGRPKDRPLFKYDESILEDLREQSALQLSMAVVHEWLWFHTDSIRANARMNRFLHSELALSILEQGREEVLKQYLVNMGFVFKKVPDPLIPGSSSNDPHDSSFTEGSHCHTGAEMYSASDLNMMAERKRSSRSYNGAALIASGLEIVVRQKICRSKGSCTDWVISNQPLEFEKSGEVFPRRGLSLQMKMLGTTHWVAQVLANGSSSALVCDGPNMSSMAGQSEADCTLRPEHNIRFVDGSDSPLLHFKGIIKRSCVHLKSDITTFESQQWGYETQVQAVIQKSFSAPMQRVQRVGVSVNGN